MDVRVRSKLFVVLREGLSKNGMFIYVTVLSSFQCGARGLEMVFGSRQAMCLMVCWLSGDEGDDSDDVCATRKIARHGRNAVLEVEG